ncbi:biotin-independent malonate decarboxylase subunit beta [Mycolicibacterium smegmatis]|uniref:biotin-independent malonate decarboxylase subunit beta n=1 Tax=Mycolicibacterium smegmatis TaxID=1772 RepID=UPI0020A56A80|nr:biotin-independent malonate decarboxylase subunit beta [Mycolicibacterium smegmatis]MCP2625402.1 biotin-independent malonate decarboxylase subunit beta [Mycolicibacterium smegmatis]MCP2626171.1 biotin-independent malonate decarboxylase subunit beta [Mycolicibacterium smegmatis]
MSNWQTMLQRRSFLEGDALTRARNLLDPEGVQVLCGPFDRIESPWLVPQGIVPQSDDGVVIARGTIDGRPVVVASIEQRFQGGAVGEVSGAKITQALRLAAQDSRSGRTTAAVLLLETGGVRLQEANLGLNAVAEICSALLDLRPLAPVVGVVAGEVGSFGGVSIAAGLCTTLVVTPQGRIGLNGPAVIEQEAGAAEFDASDRALIWSIDGGEKRHADGLADVLVPDDADALRAAVSAAVAAGPRAPGAHRSEQVHALGARLPTTPEPHNTSAPSRGRTWLTELAGTQPIPVIGSVIRADTGDRAYLAVVPDPENAYHRARHGEVGLAESLALAGAVDDVIRTDAGKNDKRAIVAVVDLPSQAYGRLEETVGLHQTIAAAVDAYHRARTAGHPVVALVVGEALSGGFLAHGLQAQRIVALDDPGVRIHAMHEEAAARITLRTVDELEALGKTVLPLSFDVRDWARLGFCDGLLHVTDADTPTEDDIATVRAAVDAQIAAARTGPRDLSNRLDSPAAEQTRQASRRVRTTMFTQWYSQA